MTKDDGTFGLDCGLKSDCKDLEVIENRSLRPCQRRSNGMVLLAVLSVTALIAVTNSNAVRRILYRTTSQDLDPMKLRKLALRHENNRAAGRKRMLKLSDYSDPKSMDEKATSTVTTTFGTTNEELYQGTQGALYDENANQMDFDAAQSTGSYSTSGNLKHMEQPQQPLSQPKMRYDGSSTLDATTNDVSPSNYATGNTPNMEMQQWQPSMQETKQQQQQQQQQQLALGGGMSTRYANAEYGVDDKANAGKVSSEPDSLTPYHQTDYQLLQSHQQPSRFGDPTSETNNYGDTSMKMETEQQWQQPAFSGSMQGLDIASQTNTMGDSTQTEQMLEQETKTSAFALPPEEEELITDKRPLKVNDRFSSPKSVESTPDSPTQQWQSYQEDSQNQPMTQTITETISSASSTSGFEKNEKNGNISKMPSSFDNIADFPTSMEPGDVAVLWNIPKGGTTAINDILAGCLQLVVANNVGAQFGHSDDQTLQVFEQHGAKFVNVETFTLDGLAKAKKLQLTSSGLVDAMVVYYVHEASELFTPTHRGFFFTMMRDPIERTLLLIRSKREDPAFASVSIKEFAQSGVLSTNWMTRWLSNQPTGPLSEDHLKYAKNILRAKFVIGIYEKIEKSLEHFEKYFGWKVLSNTHREKCVRDHISDIVQNNDVSMDMPSKDSNEYTTLLDLNHFDIELYRYAKILFMEQAGHFGKISRPIFGQ